MNKPIAPKLGFLAFRATGFGHLVCQIERVGVALLGSGQALKHVADDRLGGQRHEVVNESRGDLLGDECAAVVHTRIPI